MFGMVKRKLLLDAEKRCVDARAQILHLRAELDWRREQIEGLEAERKLLLDAVVAKSASSAASPASSEPEESMAMVKEPRILTGFEVVARAMDLRNKQAGTAPMPRITSIFAQASRQRRAAEAAKKPTGTGA